MMEQVRQLPLFAPPASFQSRDVKSVTFKGNFDYPIHRWFRLTPSFSPELVADILTHWRLPPSARVLDPFCGVGTTPLVCQERGLSSDAVELNPLLHWIAQVKTTPINDPADVPIVAREVVEQANHLITTFANLNPEAFLAGYHDAIPRIQNVTKWWSLPILKKLVALRIALAGLSSPAEISALLQLAVASILIEVSNARHNHPSLSFAKSVREDAPVFERFLEQSEMMTHDLQVFPQARPDAHIWQGNSKHLERILPAGRTFAAVITSPPYPNRYSYARETRPQIFYLGLARDSREIGELETAAIGGTWGKATSVLNEGIDYRSAAVANVLGDIPEHIGQHSRLMRHYVIKYFNDVEQHITSLQPFLGPEARLAYVIGNSKFYDVLLPSDEILADLFEAHGFGVVSIERMRRRNCKSGLYEAVVFMTAP